MSKVGYKKLRAELVKMYGYESVKRLEQEQFNMERPFNKPGRGFYLNLRKHPEKVIAALCKWALTD